MKGTTIDTSDCDRYETIAAVHQLIAHEKHRWWFACFTILVLSVLSQTSSFANENIQLQLKWKHQFQFAGIYMAIEQGYYRHEGLNIHLIEGGQGHSPIQHVLHAEAHYAISDTGALIARAHGKPIKVLAAIFQHSPLALVVRKDSEIHVLKDLKHKRIMIQQGYQNADIVAALQKVGITEKDYIRQNISYNIQDFIHQRTDAFCVYLTDQPHQLDQLGIPYQTFQPKDYGIDFYGDILITSDKEVKKHPKRAESLIRATIKGWKDALQHPEQAIDLILEKYNTQNLSREQLIFEAKKTTEMMMPSLVNIGYMHQQRWEDIAHVYAEQKLIPAHFSIDTLLYQQTQHSIYFFDFIQKQRWPIGVILLLMILFLLGCHSLRLRQAVQSRTQSLKESKMRYRILMDMLPIGIGVHVDGKWTYVNRSLLEIFGAATFEDILGSHVVNRISAKRWQYISQSAQHHHTDTPTMYEEKMRHMDGSLFEAEIMLKTITIDQKTSSMLMIKDISKYKKTQAEKIALEHQMEHSQRLESLGVLAGGIAHDFNNILMAITGNVSMAQMSTNTDSPSMKYLTRIEKSSEQAAKLCNQMLAYSGRGHFQIKDVNLSQLVQHILSLLKVSIKKDIELKLHLQHDLPTIQADQDQLQQVIMNLVINASEAIHHPQGIIDISSGIVDVNQSYLATTWLQDQLKEGSYLYLEISDTGCGMDQDTLSKIFDPFFTTKFTGRGLGMSALLGIVRGHHGTIHINSTPNQGSTFRVLFPISNHLSV